MRVNAGLGMARIIEMVQEVAMDDQPGAVGGVGQMEFYPNSRNVMPGTVVFTVDIRSPDKAELDRMRTSDRGGGAERSARRSDVGCSSRAGRPFRPGDLRQGLRQGACATPPSGSATRIANIISGAGHDACWINRVAPTTMVMCPCVDGLSHNEAEEISKEWAPPGADVLFHAVVETAEIVE